MRVLKLCLAFVLLAPAGAVHYEKPPCASDELQGNIQGVNGSLCAPKCDATGKCPTDVPAGTWHNATPACVLNDAKGDHYCALQCKFVGCPTGAHCAMVGIVVGVCVYPNGTHTAPLASAELTLRSEIAATDAAPEQPHLAQAWTALSTGDGLPGETGIEHYIYEEDKTDKSALQAHVWDYGASCKKIELNTPAGYNEEYPWGTYYIHCDAVDCCFSGRGGGHPDRPDVKKWDIAKSGLFGKIKTTFGGYNDTTELNDNPIKQAEHWHEEDHLFLPSPVKYDYFITRRSPDIISHRIDYSAPGAAPGSILYGNFTVQHNVTAFRETFKVPDMCYPQGSHRGHALSCHDDNIMKWEQKYFKHSFRTQIAASEIVV